MSIEPDDIKKFEDLGFSKHADLIYDWLKKNWSIGRPAPKGYKDFLISVTEVSAKLMNRILYDFGITDADALVATVGGKIGPNDVVQPPPPPPGQGPPQGGPPGGPPPGPMPGAPVRM